MLRLLPHLFALSLTPVFAAGEENSSIDWPVYLGDNESSQYSKVDQITPANVDKLEVAWTFNSQNESVSAHGLVECNPLVIDGVLYGIDSKSLVFALDAASGKKRWSFDQYEYLVGLGVPAKSSGFNRGLTYWTDGKEKRILFGANFRLFALDASTGKPITTFGESGYIDLNQGLGRKLTSNLYSKTPGIVFENLIIMGSTVSESLPAAPGHIRAYDIRTGKQAWRFNTIPQPGELGYETWPENAYKTAGGVNVWTGMALDQERGLVYCPTGSATYDFYGANRVGENLFANTLICLDARTGERVWHYQIIHHDIFDYDLPAPPNLFTFKKDGKEIPAVAQLTKHGFVYIFNRVTGEPLFPIEEVPVPSSTIPGEQSWPTQPRPTKPAPYVREYFTVDEITDISPESHAEILAKYKTIRPHAPFQPTSETQDTIVHPGMSGGAEWGGGATDPNGVLYFNSNEIPAIITILDLEKSESEVQTVFAQNCAICHGADLKGGTAFGQSIPSLIGVSSRLRPDEIMNVIKQGRNTMPAFQHMSNELVYQLSNYIKNPEKFNKANLQNKKKKTDRQRFQHAGNTQWRDSKGYPAIKPPWGTLNAIDLNTGVYLWKRNFGEYPELSAQGLPITGRESWGGPITTAGGILFIAASKDGHIRAYDMKTGEELWKDKLPFGGYATPATYSVDGKQYIVIACGGGRGSPSSNLFVAYALP